MALLLVVVHCLCAQTTNLPWSVLDGGGGKSSGTGMQLFSSVGQTAQGAMGSVSINLEGGYIPGTRNLSGITSTFSGSTSTGWNMISVPLLVNDYLRTTLYPGAVSPAFKYTNTYLPKDTLEIGAGYWLQYNSSDPLSMSGTTFQRESLAVTAGWNLIGCPSYPVLKADVVPVGTTIISNIFAYDGVTYALADTLYPGKAYWIQVSDDGGLVATSGYLLATPSSAMVADVQHPKKDGRSLLSPQQLKEVEGFSKLHVRDASGVERTLYYSTEKLDLTRYSLPPFAPDGNLDVRFASQRLVEVTKAGEKSNEFPIQVVGGKYPITISWDVPVVPLNSALLLRSTERIQKQYPIVKSSNIVIPTEESMAGLKLVLTQETTKELPKEFALYQNYPNPFNPTTQIRYDVPKSSHVSLKVYNLLGEELVALVDEEKETGTYSVEFDAVKFATGVYFYRFQAGDIVFTKKLMLVR